ncbi:copper amine oxidase N-terminal domain-containing protein [Cohnella sp. 56]|uniref:copper amine oxidase N-terminal domain-containing protein n=1 Tax=Cohnella sp. 56 TaxID=3113722 RepID=UPI0030EA1D53
MGKKSILSGLVLTAMLFGIGNSVSAAAQVPLSLNVNGVKLTDQQPVIIDQTTMVPIRTVSQLPHFHVDWNNKTKTVSVTNTNSKEVLKLTVGHTEAAKGTTALNVSVPPRNIGGSVYVPLRFIGESLDAFVAWDAATRTAVIYPFPANDNYKSADLVTARQAAVELPQINLREHLGFTQEIRTTTYYFPYGQSQKFFIEKGDYIRYFEVQNGAAWQKWEGHEISKKANAPDAIPNLVPAVKEEWGTRPTYNGAYVYFQHGWMAGLIDYGVMDDKGKRNELESKVGAFDKLTVYAIDGEK